LSARAARAAGAVAVALVVAAIAACGDAAGNPLRLGKIAKVYEGGDAQGAVPQLTAYLERHPRDDLAWTILGNAQEDLGQDDEATATRRPRPTSPSPTTTTGTRPTATGSRRSRRAWATGRATGCSRSTTGP
jgi:hypothetical protein